MIFSVGPLTKVGRITKTHGYAGKLRIDVEDSFDIDLKEPLFLMFHQKPVPFFVTEKSNTNPFIVSFADVNTVEEAQDFQGRDVFLPSQQLKIEEENSLIGFEIIDVNLGKIGLVEDIVSHKTQDLILTSHKKRECLIPFVDDFIEIIDEENGIITLNLPDGLLDLD